MQPARRKELQIWRLRLLVVVFVTLACLIFSIPIARSVHKLWLQDLILFSPVLALALLVCLIVILVRSQSDELARSIWLKAVAVGAALTGAILLVPPWLLPNGAPLGPMLLLAVFGLGVYGARLVLRYNIQSPEENRRMLRLHFSLAAFLSAQLTVSWWLFWHTNYSEFTRLLLLALSGTLLLFLLRMLARRRE